LKSFFHYDTGELGINIDVSLKLSDQIVNFVAKIDTGVSHCIFERQFGEQLGLERSKTQVKVIVNFSHLNSHLQSFISLIKRNLRHQEPADAQKAVLQQQEYTINKI
jgi:hypothetical protein